MNPTIFWSFAVVHQTTHHHQQQQQIQIAQNGLMGGLIFGWSSIDRTLLVASKQDGGAGVDPQVTVQIFAWASSAAMVSSFFLGIVLDKLGPRVANCFSALLVAAGTRLLASTEHFAAGCILFAFGGPGITASIIHISNLFPQTQNLIMSCCSGSIAISFSVFTVFDTLWHRYEWATFHALFGYYSILALVGALAAFLVYPDEPYKEMEQDDDIIESKIIEKVGNKEEQEEKSETHHLLQNSPTAVTASLYVGSDREGALSVIHEHTHHHDPHIHIQTAPPTDGAHIEQPLNSYLRGKKYERNVSFLVSAQAMQSDNPEDKELISLKDQPFIKQLSSAAYIRASLLFYFCTFATNFYVSTLSTELADFNQYPYHLQHELAQTFTTLMSLGCLASMSAGFLIDRIGVEICTVMCLLFGQVRILLVLIFGQEHAMLVTSFVFYCLFRSFLYPVFIALLTSRLGFKYFGVLLGLGFAISGLFQLLMASLSDAVKGNCHLATEAEMDKCSHGFWVYLHIVEFVVLVVLFFVPFMDHRDKVNREKRIQAFEQRRAAYGTIS
jgi:MFS family permease